ncbi:Polysaccharide pyruvyl transferase family protein WcaK [Bacteroides clarus YIT 12056]|jgi:colanic acid/amylovoran biosynthesis protein|uniref:Conserved domain protein n=1 Tax=Bacteroides clarus YIT 12056 TaxID=762984 RepID=A0ABN0CQG6_9BACE|nr:polysaccharide pyruvyl transferase family protein [Bacteroides clarus]EGF53190.1 conserved domain protein [Bacteroides clarus YIT 12056]SHG72273.1 Polysaccharide pyruvyl transferase family protein WcaK [Bacteroides clarus YIT 12056]
MKNVLLIGIGGVYNYGCEAIVRGTVNILKSINPEIRISYASYNYEDDLRRLTDCDIRIIQRKRIGRWSFHNIVRKLLSLVNIDYILPYDSTDWLDGYDTIFSIGGDIYTLYPDGTYDASLPLFLEKCQARGIKYVLWGASVGKFEKNSKALAFFKKHLRKIDLIVAREWVTVDYLNSLGIVQNVVFAPDPAYFVECPFLDKDKKKQGTTLGVNLSPLSALYHYGNIEIAINKQVEAICGLAGELNCRLMFLPHVFSDSMNDNDLFYLEQIANKVRSKGYSVDVVNSDPGFIGLKRFLNKCDFVIAARMHCAVNAITMNIPTIFLSYSEKANGMAEYVYNTKNAVLSLTEFEDYSQVANVMKKWDEKSCINSIKKFQFNCLLKIFD